MQFINSVSRVLDHSLCFLLAGFQFKHISKDTFMARFKRGHIFSGIKRHGFMEKDPAEA